MTLKLFAITCILYFGTLPTAVVPTSRGFNSYKYNGQYVLNQSVVNVEINDYEPPGANPGHNPFTPPPPPPVSSVKTRLSGDDEYII